MTREELMIGDWVLKDMNFLEDDPMYTQTDYQPYQIITGEDIDLACEANWLGDDVYQPIPLTLEILEKNGFVKSKYGDLTLELDDALGTTEIVLVPTYDEAYYWWRINNELITKIKSIHELQHVLRLCRIDKVITV